MQTSKKQTIESVTQIAQSDKKIIETPEQDIKLILKNKRIESNTIESLSPVIKNIEVIKAIKEYKNLNNFKAYLVPAIINQFKAYLTFNNIEFDEDLLKTIRGRLGKACNQSMTTLFKHELISMWEPKDSIKGLKRIYCKFFKAWYIYGCANTDKFKERLLRK